MAREYYIVTPSLNYGASGGVIALHRLCHLLNEMGQRAFIVPFGDSLHVTHQEWNTPQIEWNKIKKSGVSIYSEILHRPLLNTDVSITWMLGAPRFKEYYTEKAYSFEPAFGGHNPLKVVFADWSISEGKRTTDKGHVIHKAKGMYESPVGSQPFDGALVFRDNVREQLQQIKHFHSYDPYSFWSVLAALNGCVSTVEKIAGVSKNDYIAGRPMAKYLGYGDTEEQREYAASMIEPLREHFETLEATSRQQIQNLINYTQ